MLCCEYMTKITDLKPYHKNPRKITDDKFQLLSDSLAIYGDLGGIVVNVRSGEVIGGNQRTRFFQEHAGEVEIDKTPYTDAQGTVAHGYVLYKGSRYNYREVDWDKDTEEKANILANKATGFFDNEILLKDFDMNTLLETGFENFELTFFDEKTRPVIDVDNFNDTLDTYLDGEVKQIVIYMDNSKYSETIENLKKIMEKTGRETNTDVIIDAIDDYAKKILG